MDWPNMAPKCLPQAVGAPKIQPPKRSGPFQELLVSGVFGRKSQQNLVYRCSLGRCFLRFMLREPHPTISSPHHIPTSGRLPYPLFKEKSCAVSHSDSSARKNTSQTDVLPGKREMRHEDEVRCNPFNCDSQFYFWVYHLVDPSIHPS